MEAPHLSAIAGKYADRGLVVLAVNAWDEPKDVVARFAKQENLQQRILLDGGDVAEQYNVVGIPTTLWIDPKGVVVATELDFKSVSSLERKCNRLVSAGSS